MADGPSAVVQDNPQDMVRRAREMISARGGAMNAENLNRAMQMIHGTSDVTDFEGMLEQRGNPTARARGPDPLRPRGPDSGEQTSRGTVPPREVADQPPASAAAPAQGPRISPIPQGTEESILNWLETNGGIPPSIASLPPSTGTASASTGRSTGRTAAASELPREPTPAAPVQSNPQGSEELRNPDASAGAERRNPYVGANGGLRMPTGAEAVEDPTFQAMLPMLMGPPRGNPGGAAPMTGGGVTLAPPGIAGRGGMPATRESTAYRMYPEAGPTVTQGPARIGGPGNMPQLPTPPAGPPSLPPGPGGPPGVGGPGAQARIPFDRTSRVNDMISEMLRRRAAGGGTPRSPRDPSSGRSSSPAPEGGSSPAAPTENVVRLPTARSSPVAQGPTDARSITNAVHGPPTIDNFVARSMTRGRQYGIEIAKNNLENAVANGASPRWIARYQQMLQDAIRRTD